MTRPHQYEITDDDLLGIADGPSRASTLEMLRSAQLSKHMLLIRMLGDECAQSHWEDAFAVFERAQASPAATQIIAHPWAGAWASQCIRHLNDSGTLPGTEMLHFNALAAAVAVRAGIDAELALPVRDELAYVPTLGAIRVNGNRDSHLVNVRQGGLPAIPDEPDVDTPAWLSHRWLVAGDSRVMLDDLSPYRNCFGLRLAGRLADDALPDWRRLWGEAWSLLTRWAPARKRELQSCVNTVVPLAKGTGRAGFSATSREAFGAFALSHPSDGATLAATMVHEAQHAKLGALLDLVNLYDGRSPNRYFAPWRADPRPIGGLMAGTHAFLAIADTWWRLSADPGLERFALRQFAHIRQQVAVAAGALERAPELTGHGRVFAAGIRSALDRLLAVDLPSQLVREAGAAVERLHVKWREGHPTATGLG